MDPSSTERLRLRRSFGVAENILRRPGIDAESAFERVAGLKARYSKGNFRERQFEDPFTGRLVFFPVRAHTENWLLRTFDPRVAGRIVPNEPMQALACGNVLAVRPALLWMDSNGKDFADFVEPEKGKEAGVAWDKFQAIVGAHGFVPVYRSRDEVQGNRVLVANLRHWHQHLVNHAACRREAAALTLHLDQWIRQPGVHTVGDLYARGNEFSVGATPRVVDCAVIYLYLVRKLTLAIEEERYGSDMRIEPL